MPQPHEVCEARCGQPRQPGLLQLTLCLNLNRWLELMYCPTLEFLNSDSDTQMFMFSNQLLLVEDSLNRFLKYERLMMGFQQVEGKVSI